jgi:hypothetical protein
MSSDLIIPGKYINTIVMARLWQQKSDDQLECHSVSLSQKLPVFVSFPPYPTEHDFLALVV